MTDKLFAKAGALSGGQQQLLAIARALLGRPMLLLLDEVSLGLAPKVTAEIFAKLDELRRDWELAILLAEQNIHLSLSTADRGYVLDSGELVAEGAARDLADNDVVERIYLGR
jgi:branched-chain amino acid transport system ATP-binding protein